MDERAEGNEATELVFALCHEIGNLLAASRMQADLLDSNSDSAEIGHAATTISDLSARMGSLVSLVRPILSEPSVSPPSVDALDLFEGLQHSLNESCEERVRFNLKSAVDLPRALIDPEPLHHLLLNAIYHGLEESEPSGVVVVAVRAEAGELKFSIEDPGPDRRDGGALRGRGLSEQIADVVLNARGGRIDRTRGSASNRVEVTVPAPAD